MENKKKFNMSLLDDEQIISEKSDYEIIYKSEIEKLKNTIRAQDIQINQQHYEIMDLRTDIYYLKQCTKNLFEYISNMHIDDGYLYTDYKILCDLKSQIYQLGM